MEKLTVPKGANNENADANKDSPKKDTPETPTTAANTPANNSQVVAANSNIVKNQKPSCCPPRPMPSCGNPNCTNPACYPKMPGPNDFPREGESYYSPAYIRRKYFPFKMLPWWALIIAMVYVLQRIKFLYHESPCSVLGINDSEGITISSLKKAFRNSSMCTHPDRLTYRLGRSATKEEEHKGQVLFNRYSNARDSLQEEIQRKQAKRDRKIERKLKTVNHQRKKERLPPLDFDDYVQEQRELYKEQQAAKEAELETLKAEGKLPEAQKNITESLMIWKNNRSKTNIFDDKATTIYCEDLEYGFAAMYRDFKDMFGATGWKDVWQFCKDFTYTICTFEAGFLNTIGLMITLFFLYKCFAALFGWMRGLGLNAPLYVLGAITVGPFPTVFYFFATPAIRVYVFATAEFIPFLKAFLGMEGAKMDGEFPLTPRQLSDKKNDDAGAVVEKKGSKSTANIKLVSEEAVNKNLRKRRQQLKKDAVTDEAVKKIQEEEEKEEEENERLIAGGAVVAAGSANSNAKSGNPGSSSAPVSTQSDRNPMDFDPSFSGLATRENMSVYQKIAQSTDTPNKSRMQIAAATQFDLLLPLTKPVFPLLMLLCTGQVWSGLIPAVFSSHILRNWVPRMNYETHHFIAFLFGFLHTILGLSAAQVEQHADAEQISGILLKWEWGVKDMVSVLNMILIGAFVASLSQLGNEPQFCCSFASGLSFRILSRNIGLYADFIPFYYEIAGWMYSTGNSLGIVMDQVDDLFAMAGGGIGDCTGGFYRSMASGDENLANWIAFAVKLWLFVLPTLSAFQWMLRAYKGSNAVGKGADRRQRRKRWLRVALRAFMGLQGLAQVALLFTFDLNASHGGLINFWLAFLLGAIFESLLALEDIRGMFRQLCIMVIFIFS